MLNTTLVSAPVLTQALNYFISSLMEEKKGKIKPPLNFNLDLCKQKKMEGEYINLCKNTDAILAKYLIY